MMNKTIKIIATATAALMMIAGVSACGSDTGGDSDKGRVYYLNLKPEDGQVIYHFASGYAVKDRRITEE